jgi:hypothetical protein
LVTRAADSGGLAAESPAAQDASLCYDLECTAPPKVLQSKEKNEITKVGNYPIGQSYPRLANNEDPTSSCNPLILLAFSYASGL